MRVVATLAIVALLAGCTAPGGARFPAHHETRFVDASELFPGLTLTGTLEGGGESLRITATARNDGPRTYSIETGCTDPWTDLVFLGNQSLLHRRPTAECAAFSVRDFLPNETATFEAEWTGLLYDDEKGTFHRAPAGDYVWSVRFLAYSGSETATVKRLDLDFPVTVV